MNVISRELQDKLDEADRTHRAFMEYGTLRSFLFFWKFKRLYNEAQRANEEARKALEEAMVNL